MDWSVVLTPILAFAGVAVAEFVKLKSKKLDISSNKAIQECSAKHTNDFAVIKNEFSNRLDAINDSLSEIKNEQLRLSLTVGQLQKEVVKHNGVIERTYSLENKVAVLENRESVSEHRLSDLEKGAS